MTTLFISRHTKTKVYFFVCLIFFLFQQIKLKKELRQVTLERLIKKTDTRKIDKFR